MGGSVSGGTSDHADVVATGVVSRGEDGSGAGGDADVVVTGVVSKGEGGAGAGSFAQVVATGVVNRREDREGASIDVDGIWSRRSEWSRRSDACLHPHVLSGITPGCPGACYPTLPVNSPWYWQPGGIMGGSEKTWIACLSMRCQLPPAAS